VSVAVELHDVFRVHSTPEGDAAALQGLTLDVREREIVTVLGPSGSGKSTLLRILAGLDRASAGSVRVFGLELSRLSAAKLAAYRTQTLGYADQHYELALAPELSALELVAQPLALRGVGRRARRARAEEFLDCVGLAAKSDARASELSRGEQQRVAVCAAVAHRPRLLLADEPTGELDAGSAALVYDAIGTLARESECTALVVSHDPASSAIADRIVRIRDGRVAGESARQVAEEDGIVVGRGGWLRLPEELLARAGIGTRARAHVADEGIVLTADGPAETVLRDVAVEPLPLVRGQGIVASVTGVAKSYGSGAAATRVFDALDAQFRAGALHAVTGSSGSGKTTLLHLLAGLELPDAGVVSVLGTPLSGLDRADRAAFRREAVALVRQEIGLIPFLSARENVELALALRGLERGEATQRAVETLDALGLAERTEQRVARLSSGERGRVAIARAVAARPALLLADEPSARLDQANALAVAALLRTLAHEYGAAVVCATHDPLVIEQADEQLALDAPVTAVTGEVPRADRPARQAVPR
jgi:ABC-type lipoprotein export system ATPase subunit